jgi:hypothetical protein
VLEASDLIDGVGYAQVGEDLAKNNRIVVLSVSWSKIGDTANNECCRSPGILIRGSVGCGFDRDTTNADTCVPDWFIEIQQVV